MQAKLQHLLWRTGFGPATTERKQWEKLSEAAWWPTIKKASAKAPEYLDVADNAVTGLLQGAGAIGKVQSDTLDKEQKKKLRQASKDGIKNLNLRWLEEMVHSEAQLREKMAFFWHGHFASLNINILYQQQMLQVIRKNALGNFGNLLREVSKSAAMLAFLNNQQNKKKHPNENFAREVMELFTLGRGNYSENDVKEAARAFTGWGFEMNGDFVFRRQFHDDDSKMLLGKTGNFDGDAVLDILLEQPQTARFITRKLYRFLVNEEQLPEARIDQLADVFFRSKYDIMGLLDAIFTSDWFYEPANMGAKIKSPIELWAGIRRAVPMQVGNPESQLLLQKALGQVLFYPPNVAGWPGGRQWIDSSSLMLRLRIPQLLLDSAELDVRTKSDDDTDMGMRDDALERRRRRLKLTPDWKPLLDEFRSTESDELIPAVARMLWQIPNASPPRGVLERYTNRSDHDDQIKTTMVQLMATPEYQLC